jgi:hypothetical protein
MTATNTTTNIKSGGNMLISEVKEQTEQELITEDEYPVEKENYKSSRKWKIIDITDKNINRLIIGFNDNKTVNIHPDL